jgi:hypothetical protein
MRRILLLTTLAAMLVAAMALSGVTQARPIRGSADAQCAKLAIKTLGPSFNPSNYTFHGGTEGNDINPQGTVGADVFCGFGGEDQIFSLEAGDIFLGGEGNDFAGFIFPGGIFYGGPGNDFVSSNNGTFFGGEGFDSVRSGNLPVDGPDVP